MRAVLAVGGLALLLAGCAPDDEPHVIGRFEPRDIERTLSVPPCVLDRNCSLNGSTVLWPPPIPRGVL